MKKILVSICLIAVMTAAVFAQNATQFPAQQPLSAQSVNDIINECISKLNNTLPKNFYFSHKTEDGNNVYTNGNNFFIELENDIAISIVYFVHGPFGTVATLLYVTDLFKSYLENSEWTLIEISDYENLGFAYYYFKNGIHITLLINLEGVDNINAGFSISFSTN